MRIATILLALFVSLWCFGVTVYALWKVFGAVATLATITAPFIALAMLIEIDRVDSLKKENR